MRASFSFRSMVAVFLLMVPAAMGQTRRPLTVNDLFTIKRVDAPVLSPDGTRIVYTVTSADLAKNATSSDLWLTGIDGGHARQLTASSASDKSPAWSPDGSTIAFISSRSGSAQVWLINASGGEAWQVTSLATEASSPVWSPDGKWIAFVSDVFPEYSDKPFAEGDSLSRAKQDVMKQGAGKARIVTHLLYKHWDRWVDGKRKHIFVMPMAGGKPAGDPRDLTPGDRDAVPTSSTFSGGIDYAFSPDSREIAYTATPVPVQEEAWRTNHDMYTVPVTGGTPRQITSNPAADGFPRYSPDGAFIAYRAQARPGFEADRWQLMLYDRKKGTTRSLTENFDAHAGPEVWAPDASILYFESEEQGNVPVFSVTTRGNDVRKVIDGATHRAIAVAGDGKHLVFTRTSYLRPPEVYRATSDGKEITQLTTTNDSLFAGIDVPAPRSIWYDGEGGTRIQAWLFTPPGFDPARKYPFVYLVHGGPQNAWLNSWSYRWNPPLWAAQGYVVMAPNPRGSTGFGQKFINEISGDWGGKVYADLMNGLAYAESLPYVDKDRKAAAGASFGGYMMNWFLGHAGNRFRTIVCHDGVFNFESMYGTTDEVWFDEWDHGGTPWDTPEEYRRYSPHVYAKNFRTPTLVIHSELDFRVPLGEGMQLFTTLQRLGVRSKFLYFPDEGHIVLKPGNSELWHRTVFSWLAEYLR